MTQPIQLPLPLEEGNQLLIHDGDFGIHFTFNNELQTKIDQGKVKVELHINGILPPHVLSDGEPKFNLGLVQSGNKFIFQILTIPLVKGGLGGDAASSSGEIIVQ